MALTQVNTKGITDATVANADLANEAVNEAKLQISNAGTNGQFLQKQSGNTGGLTWADGASEGTEVKSTGVSGTSSYLRADGDGTSSWQTVSAGAGGATGLDLNDDTKIRLGSSNDLELYHDAGGSGEIRNNTGNLYIRGHSANGIVLQGKIGENSLVAHCDGGVDLYYDNSKKFETTSGGITVTGNAVATSKFRGNDNVKLSLGDSEDLQIFHNGSASYIQDTGTGNLVLSASDGIIFQNGATTETLARFYENGACELYHNNSKKLETASNGIAVAGQVDCTGGGVLVDDSYSFSAGTGGDLLIYHDGSNSYLKTTTGHMFHDSQYNQYFRNQDGSETRAIFGADGAVELYYDNVKKLNTTSDGITMTGNISFSSGNNGLYLGGSGGGNHLNDYEKGDYTPTLFFGNDTEASYNSGTTAGSYVKVGKSVWVNGKIAVTSRNSSTSTVILKGFPFSQDVSGQVRGGGFITQWWGTPSGWTDRPYHIGFDTATNAYIRFWNGANMADLNGGHLDDSFDIYYVILYYTT